MKAHIRWIFFENNDLGEFIKNDSNNENWPIASTYAKRVFEDWQLEINQQQEEINLLETKNNKTRQLLANIQTWFINEHNLLGKPIKRALIEKLSELNRFERELKVHQYELDHPKKELAEHEKQCLLNKIRIGERKISNCKDEIDEMEKLWREEEKELCQRLSYTRDNLQPYLRNPEERIDPITRKLLITSKYYHEFWRKFHDIHPESEPLAELNKLLDEWYNHNEGKGSEPNPYEIEVHERNSEKLTFSWIPIERKINERKGKYLPFLNNYLFNYYGEWFEVENWDQLSYNQVKITAERSIFYNDYYYLIKSGANGILHHSESKLIEREEICSCPQYNIATNFYDFGSAYELNLKLYKLNNSLVEIGYWIKEEDLEMVVPTNLSPAINPEDEKNVVKALWDGLITAGIGTVYFLLSDRLGDIIMHRKNFAGNETKWKEIGQDTKGNQSPVGNEINSLLEELGLDKPEMFHFLRHHIKATLYWRKKQIWQGNYWLVHSNFWIKESVNPSGTCLTFFGYQNTILTRVTESISAKIGGNSFVNKFFECVVDTTLNDDKGQNNRQTERSVVSESSTNGGEVKRKETATKTTTRTKDLTKGDNSGIQGSNFLQPHLYSIDHTKAEYTFYQFWHRYILSGKYPLSLRIEFNQNLLNQYKKKRKLKGKMTYDYYNSLNFGGEILNFPGFLKSSVISTNMLRNSNWFRAKIESGIFLWENNHRDFYQKKLPSSVNIESRGGNATGDFNLLRIIKNLKESIGRDKQTGVDGMSWVWKNNGTAIDGFTQTSYCIQESNGEDLFPKLIEKGSAKMKIDSPAHSGSSCPHQVCLPRSLSNHPGSWRFGASEKWSGVIPFLRGVWYSWFMGGFNEGEGDKREFRARDNNCQIILMQDGAEWALRFIGEFEEIRPIGESEGNPPSDSAKTHSFTPLEIPTKLFDPNSLPTNSNLTPSPTGSGEIEVNVPDIDNGPDPDFGTDPDGDPEKPTDPDPTKDPEKPTDPDTGPAPDWWDPDDPDNDSDFALNEISVIPKE